MSFADWMRTIGTGVLTYPTSYFDWYVALGVSIIATFVVPLFVYQFFIRDWKLKRAVNNLPDISVMPEKILRVESQLTSWEKTFASDMQRKFAEPDLKSEITRKQCVKVVEVYLERVEQISKDRVDLDKAQFVFDGRLL